MSHRAAQTRAWLTRFGSTQRSAEPAILALAGGVVALEAGLMFWRATTPWASLPDSDYWGNISGLITEAGVRLDLAELFRHNNEHVVPIPKLIYVANYLVTSGSNIGLIVYSLVVGAACSALLLFLVRDLLIDTPRRYALCALLFPLAIFSTKLTHSYFLGMSGVIWLTADLFVIASAAALARAVATESSSWLLLSLAAALLGILTYSTAVYALLVLLLFCLAKLFKPALPGPRSRPVLIATATLIVAVLGLGLVFRNLPRHHPGLEFDFIRLVEFVLIYIGNALTTGPLRIVAALVILAAGATAIRRLIGQGRGKDALLWIILFLFAPFNAVTTGIGRLGYGVKVAASSRYQSVTAISLIATIVLVLAALPKGPVSRRATVARNLTFIALLVCGAVIALNRSNVANFTARNKEKVIAEIALRQGIQGKQHIRAVTPAPGQLERLIPVLRAAHHVPFNWRSRCEDRLGRPIDEVGRPAEGLLESLSTYAMSRAAGQAMELSGWAERDGAAAECIVIVDGARTVIGAGASIARRHDVERAEGRSLGSVGWKAVATLPATMPVCALALFPGDDRLAPLANCKDKVETPAPPVKGSASGPP